MTDPLIDPPKIDPEAYRARQRANARVLAILLGVFVVLVFAISWAKIVAGMHA